MERSPEYAKVLAGLGQYAHQKIEKVLKEMLSELFLTTPDDPIELMIQYIKDYKRNQQVSLLSPHVYSTRRQNDVIANAQGDLSMQGHSDDNDDDGSSSRADSRVRSVSTSSLPGRGSAPPPDHLDALPIMESKINAYNRNKRRVAVSAEPVSSSVHR